MFRQRLRCCGGGCGCVSTLSSTLASLAERRSAASEHRYDGSANGGRTLEDQAGTMATRSRCGQVFRAALDEVSRRCGGFVVHPAESSSCELQGLVVAAAEQGLLLLVPTLRLVGSLELVLARFPGAFPAHLRTLWAFEELGATPALHRGRRCGRRRGSHEALGPGETARSGACANPHRWSGR